MKKLITFLLFLSLMLSLSAQKKEIPTPENVGKHLFELFQNRADIKSSPFYKSTMDDGLWAFLLSDADCFKLTSDKVSYNRTYFEQTRKYGSSSSVSDVEIHVLMDIESSGECAFKATLEWNNGWKIQSVDAYLYDCQLGTAIGYPLFRRDLTEEDEKRFESYIEYPYNTSYKVSQIEETTYLPDIATLNNAIFEALKNTSAFGTQDFFITEQEYEVSMAKQNEKQDSIRALEVKSEYTRGEMLRQYRSILRDYKKEQVAAWDTLVKECKDEFGKGTLNFKLLNTEATISSYSSTADYIVFANVEAQIAVNAKEERILDYQAIWLNGKWKLLSVQDYLMKRLVGISIMDVVGDDEDVVFELSPITIE